MSARGSQLGPTARAILAELERHPQGAALRDVCDAVLQEAAGDYSQRDKVLKSLVYMESVGYVASMGEPYRRLWRLVSQEEHDAQLAQEAEHARREAARLAASCAPLAPPRCYDIFSAPLYVPEPHRLLRTGAANFLAIPSAGMPC